MKEAIDNDIPAFLLEAGAVPDYNILVKLYSQLSGRPQNFVNQIWERSTKKAMRQMNVDKEDVDQMKEKDKQNFWMVVNNMTREQLKMSKAYNGMNINDILTHSLVEPDIRNSMYVKPKLSGSRVIRGKTITSIPWENESREHFQSIKPKDPSYKGKIVDCPSVVVTCDCKRYQFYWEYALHHNLAAKIIHCNGNPPIITNPLLVPGCCKHLYVIMQALKG